MRAEKTLHSFRALAGGGTAGYGTLYRLSLGLQPFVKTITGFGKAGGVVGILGNGLTGTTSVTFNGIPATFSVVSNTAMGDGAGRCDFGANSGDHSERNAKQ